MRRRFFSSDSRVEFNTNNYLTIEALEDRLTASLSMNACEYCIDGDGNWKSLAADTATPSINAGQTLSFRGELTSDSSMGIGTFTISKRCNLEGNCMSMLFGDNAADNLSLVGTTSTFDSLFYNCTTIINVSSDFLPATILSTGCYQYMFYGCTSLQTAPELPATILANRCYYSMFQGCTSLQTAPELPATTLADYCYYSMFRGCTSLQTAPELPATTLVYYCYNSMFYGCAILNYIEMLATDISATRCLTNWVYGVAFSGTFVKNIYADWIRTGDNGVPTYWTLTHNIVNSGCIIGKFNVASSSTVRICNATSQLASIVVDGVVRGINTHMYLYSGEHTIRFYIKEDDATSLFAREVPVYSLDFSKLNSSVDINSICISNAYVETVTIGNNIKDIDSYAFQYCSNLKSVIFGRYVSTIGKYAFAYSGVESIDLSTIVDTNRCRIYEFAFAHCYSLTTINFGTVVRLDSDGILSTASALTDIYIRSTTAPSITSTTFWNVKSGGTLHYPAGADYSEWMQESSYYLGYYDWTSEEI